PSPLPVSCSTMTTNPEPSGPGPPAPPGDGARSGKDGGGPGVPHGGVPAAVMTVLPETRAPATGSPPPRHLDDAALVLVAQALGEQPVEPVERRPAEGCPQPQRVGEPDAVRGVLVPQVPGEGDVVVRAVRHPPSVAD